jgi:Uma2 family endonuclease
MNTVTIPPAAPALMTAEEFLKLHGGECSVDLVKGRIVRDTMPGGEHGRICFEAAAILRDFVKPRDLGRLMTNDTFIYAGSNPDSVRGADVSYIM